MVQLTPYKLNATEDKKWGETRAMLLYQCPAFSSIMYSMLSKGDQVAIFTKDPAVPIAATDGSALILNPDGFFGMELAERVFVLAHEILHCIFDHCALGYKARKRGKIHYPDGSSLPYDHDQLNQAEDYVINDVLVEGRVGKMPKVGLHDKGQATHMDSALDVYKRRYKKLPPPPPQPGFDKHLDPGTTGGQDPASAVAQRNDQVWQNAVAAAASAAKAMGKLPACLERILMEALEPQVDWKDRIQATFARRVGNARYDWRKVDRRLVTRDIIAPGRSGYGADTIVVAGDTSGSINDKTLNMFYAEMYGILEDTKCRRIILMWCDAHVHGVHECDDAADLNTQREKSPGGGGGTSFTPVFDKINEMGLEPDALIYLTDLYGTFPEKAPDYPVIWGCINSGKAPFGDTVEIPKQVA